MSGTEADNDDLIPLFGHKPRAPLPVDFSTLKRKKPHPDNASDKNRFYRGANDEEVVIDEDLLSEDELLYGEQEDQYEEADSRTKRQRVQESTTREIIARTTIRQRERARQKLSRDQKRLAAVLRQQDLTNGDLLQRYANDEEHLISIPVKSPYQSFVTETLGPEEPRINCFGCTKGVGLARIAPRAIGNLERMIKETISTQDIWTACVMISQHYEEEIRIPSNAARNPKLEAELPQWSERSVHDHLTSHTLEPSFVLFKCIMEIREHLKIITSSGLYRVPKEVYASGRPIELSDLVIDDKRHKQFIETNKLLMQAMSQRPDRMMFNNSNYNLTSTPQQIVVQKTTAVAVEAQDSVFRRTDLTEKATYKQV